MKHPDRSGIMAGSWRNKAALAGRATGPRGIHPAPPPLPLPLPGPISINNFAKKTNLQTPNSGH
jgi:hypothetical protein